MEDAMEAAIDIATEATMEIVEQVCASSAEHLGM